MNFRTSRIGACALCLVACACTTVGPDYKTPKLEVPAAFTEAHASVADGAGNGMPVEDAWWKTLKDPLLERLISQALRSAPDIAEAGARVREARALRGVVRADQYPSVDGAGEYQRTHGSDNVPIGVPPGGLGPGESSDLWQVGFDASWEIDIFGGRRRAIEAADANYAAVSEDRADVVLTLLAEIARDYVEVRGAQRRIELAQKNLGIEQDLQQLTASLLAAGLAPRQDLLRAQAQVAAVEAAIPVLRTDERAACHRIAALLGLPFSELLAELSAPRPIPQAEADVPVGLPSELLERRPDIRAAERRIAAANARIGVAQADLYPHFSLTGLAGFESLNIGSFPMASSGYYQIGPEVSWRIFDAGKIRSQMLAETARTDAATAAYQRSLFNAFRDVETALVSHVNVRLRRDRLAAESASDAEAVDVARLLYERGVDSFLPLLDAERALSESDDQLAQAERDSALTLIALFKSLGGGWRSASETVD